MTSDQFRSEIYDVALDPERWLDALRILTEAMGFVGASCRLVNHRTGQNDWIGAHGPTSRGKADYLAHYYSHDRLVPAVQGATPGQIVQIRKALTPDELRQNPWYNEHLRKLGIDDGLSVPMFRTPRYTAVLTVHHGREQRPIEPADIRKFAELADPFTRAARLHTELKEVGLRAAAGILALDELGAGMIVTDENGQVHDMNRAAERMAEREDGFTVRLGSLRAIESVDSARLAALIAAAARLKGSPVRRMRLRRRRHMPYELKVVPFHVTGGLYGRPLAMIVVIEPEARVASRQEVRELYGWSRAETEVAMGVATGKPLTEIAAQRGKTMNTVRSQLASAMKKAGCHRQVDLVRLLSGSGIASSGTDFFPPTAH